MVEIKQVVHYAVEIRVRQPDGIRLLLRSPEFASPNCPLGLPIRSPHFASVKVTENQIPICSPHFCRSISFHSFLGVNSNSIGFLLIRSQINALSLSEKKRTHLFMDAFRIEGFEIRPSKITSSIRIM